MAEKNGGGSPSKPASSAASPSVTNRSPQELLAAVAVGLIAFFATDGHVVVRAVLAALALLALLLATVGLEVLQDYQKQSKQPKANKFDIVVRKIDLPAAPPGGVFAAAAAMEKHLQGFALSAKPDVKPVENGFTVLCGNQRLRARVAAGTAFGWQVGEKGWLEGRENWMAAVRAAPRGAEVRRVNWMGVCELAASAPPTAEAAAPDGSVEALEVGRAVRLQNLASKPELNGKPGVVAVKANENGRYGVRVDGVKEPMSIHGRNLAPMGKFDRVGLSVRRAQLGRAIRPRRALTPPNPPPQVPALRSFRAAHSALLPNLTTDQAKLGVLMPLTAGCASSLAAALARANAKDEAGVPLTAPATVFVVADDESNLVTVRLAILRNSARFCAILRNYSLTVHHPFRRSTSSTRGR